MSEQSTTEKFEQMYQELRDDPKEATRLWRQWRAGGVPANSRIKEMDILRRVLSEHGLWEILYE